MASTRKAIISTGKTRIMGVLNVTPDSFSDGGQFMDDSDNVYQQQK